MQISKSLSRHIQLTPTQRQVNERAEEFSLRGKLLLKMGMSGIEKEVPGFFALMAEVLADDRFKIESSFPYGSPLQKPFYGLPHNFIVSAYAEGRAKHPSTVRAQLAILFEAVENYPKTQLVITGRSLENDEDPSLERGEVGLSIEQKWFKPTMDHERARSIKIRNLPTSPRKGKAAQKQVNRRVREFLTTMGSPDIIIQLREAVTRVNEAIQEAKGEDIFSHFSKLSKKKRKIHQP